MEKAPFALITIESIRFRIRDQSGHVVFSRRNLMADHFQKTDKTWDYSLKFLELEVSP